MSKLIGGVLLLLSAAIEPAVAEMPEERRLVPQEHGNDHDSKAQWWCTVHGARGELRMALADCNRDVVDRPHSPGAFSNRGSIYLLAGEFDRALPDFEWAISLAPQDAFLRFNLGLALGKLGRGAEAISSYTEAVRLNPKLAIAYHNRGVEHELAGRTQDAIVDYKAALSIDKNLKPSIDGLERLAKPI